MLATVLVLQVVFAVALVATDTNNNIANTVQAKSQRRFFFTAPSLNKNCVVVGGGPIGLAAALTLSRSPHFYNVTILEASDGMSLVSKYDPSRSYLYNINPKGLQWFMDDTMAPNSAYFKLQQRGYCASPTGKLMGQICIVPANPTDFLPVPKQVSVMGTSPRMQSSLQNRANYWIPRHEMIELLYECCQEHTTKNDPQCGTIQMYSGKRVDTIFPSIDNDNLVSVHCQDGSIYTGSLIVAADGVNSTVRSCLAGCNVSPLNQGASWLQSRPSSFRLRSFKSPATGLKLKALQFSPANFVLQNGTTTNETQQFFRPQSTDFVAIRGINTGTRNRLSIGLLPMKDPNKIRPGNTITPYDHEIWSLKDGPGAKLWFAKNYPRIDWDSALVNNDSEWDRFVRARGTTYPYCSYSPGSAVASPNGLCGVVMIGDACTFICIFPPVYCPP
jgi:kynurenine 3-monooxygenase